MTATLIEDEVTNLSDLDFEISLVCESPVGCDKVPKWKMTIGCCGKTFLLCQDCVDEVIEWASKIKKTQIFDVQCRYCGKIVPADKFIGRIKRI